MWFLISNSSFLVFQVCDPDWDRAKQRKAKIQEALASSFESTETTTKDPATSWRELFCSKFLDQKVYSLRLGVWLAPFLSILLYTYDDLDVV